MLTVLIFLPSLVATTSRGSLTDEYIAVSYALCKTDMVSQAGQLDHLRFIKGYFCQ